MNAASHRSTSTQATVRTLLSAAGLKLPEDELAAVAAGYPAMRAQLDEMFTLPMPREETPDLSLRLEPLFRTRPKPRRPQSSPSRT